MILSFLFIGTSFANVKPIINQNKVAENPNKHLNDKNDEFGCRVSCYATVTNTETGQSMTFYGSATAELCGTASLMCQTSVLQHALAYIDSQQ